MNKSVAIGIDLGTTNSCVSIMEMGVSKIIKNKQGNRTTPSVVAFNEKGEIVIGELAKRQLIANPDKVIYSIKRHMGEADWKTHPINGVRYTPEEISAFILKELKSQASDYLGYAVTEVVITVPAYFNDLQRNATKHAAEIAGLKVSRIINEPTAAALAYKLNNKDKKERVLVFDLGGGTFDVSILLVENGVFSVEATSGDNHLGGDDFDQRIAEWLIREIKKDTGKDLGKDKVALQRLRLAAEEAKKDLSSTEVTTIQLPYISEGISVNKELSRAYFEEMTSDLLNRTVAPSEQAIKDAGISISDIDEVILVGGSTRMSMVHKLVEKLFKKTPNMSVDPDEVVAVGAAIEAAVKIGQINDLVLVDVIPLSLGIAQHGGMTSVIIPRNTSIPTKKTQTYTTVMDNQPIVEITVVQGERPFAEDNEQLGKFTLSDIEIAPRGIPKIDVEFLVDENGMLHVTAKDQKTGKANKVSIKRSTFTEEQIKNAMENAKKFEENDEKRLRSQVLRNSSESLLYEIEKLQNEKKDSINDEQSKNINDILHTVREVLEKSDKYEEYEECVKKLGDAETQFRTLSEELRKGNSEDKKEDNTEEEQK